VNTKDIVTFGMLAAIGFAVWKLADVGKDVADKASTAIANLWLKLRPLPPAIELLGNVKFPGNILVPLQQLSRERAIRADESGAVFVRYADHTWKLGPQVFGNWPATLVE
jgi:hypothetical protein